MQLDKRIKALSDILTCFDIERAGQFIGQKGYFTDDLFEYDSLENGEYGTLTEVLDNKEPFKVGNRCHWRYFIPECFVKPKEKQYRPYTLEEFNDKFTIGCSIITFRRKAYAELIHNVLFIGYREDDVDLILLLGNAGYSLEELFNEYECKNSLGKWVPFGKRVEE